MKLSEWWNSGNVGEMGGNGFVGGDENLIRGLQV